MKQLFFLAIFIFITGFAGAQDETVILKTSTGELEGSLSIPDQKTGMPLVLIIAGSGPTDRNGNSGDLENNSLKLLASELKAQGIASFRFDKRGVGQSSGSGDEMELRFETFVDDVKAWITLLSADKRFSRLIVAGHSEGSLLGILAAQKNHRVSALISIAGAGRPIDLVIKEQLAPLPEDIKAVVFEMMDRVKKGDTITNVPPIYYSLLRPSIQPYMRSWFKYDPAMELKKLDIPLLIVQGTTDLQVGEKDAELLAKANSGAKLAIIANMNHVLKDCQTRDKEQQKPIYSDPSLPLNEEFVKTMVNFIR